MSPGKVLEWCGVVIVASIALIVAVSAITITVESFKYILS